MQFPLQSSDHATLRHDLMKDFDNAYSAISWLQKQDYRAATWAALAAVKTLQGFDPEVQEYLDRVTTKVELYMRGDLPICVFEEPEEEDFEDLATDAYYARYAAWYLEYEISEGYDENEYGMLEPIAMVGMCRSCEKSSDRYKDTRKQVYKDLLPVIADAMLEYPAASMQ